LAKLRILIAEDHAIFRASLERRLSVKFEVIGAVSDGKSLVELARRLEPDIIVSDITMPRLSGLEAARQLVDELPDVKIVFVTVHTSRAYVREAFRAGARGYVQKSSSIEELEEALSEVHRGNTYLSKKLCDEGRATQE